VIGTPVFVIEEFNLIEQWWIPMYFEAGIYLLVRVVTTMAL